MPFSPFHNHFKSFMNHTKDNGAVNRRTTLLRCYWRCDRSNAPDAVVFCSRHSSGGQWFYAHCSSKTNRAHSQVDRHSSNFKFLPKHYFDIRTTNFFVGHVVSSDDRSIQIFATYSRNTTSVSPLRTHRKLGQLQEYDVTRIWKLRVQTSLVLETYELVTLPVLGQFWANYIPPIVSYLPVQIGRW